MTFPSHACSAQLSSWLVRPRGAREQPGKDCVLCNASREHTGLVWAKLRVSCLGILLPRSSRRYLTCSPLSSPEFAENMSQSSPAEHLPVCSREGGKRAHSRYRRPGLPRTCQRSPSQEHLKELAAKVPELKNGEPYLVINPSGVLGECPQGNLGPFPYVREDARHGYSNSPKLGGVRQQRLTSRVK